MRSDGMIPDFDPHKLDNDAVPMRRATKQDTINALLRIAAWEIVVGGGSDPAALERAIRRLMISGATLELPKAA
jgi:hypothetical protein